MSAALDTINRNKILTILEDILEEDELRLVRFLLSNTTLETRINKADIQAPFNFNSNIGTPQGDGLSPVLFTIYLEHALRKTRTVIGDPTTKLEELIPREIAYADNVDFIGSQYIDIDAVENALKEFDLIVNVNKTELTSISKEETEWRKTKKVGSLIGDTEDVERRKQLSNVALYKLKNVWISKDKIKREIKIKLYKSLVESILIYNCGTWALTQTEANKLDTFHRKQLRNILDIHYPTLISNKFLYKICNETPLSVQIVESRWRLFGHTKKR
ncbi:endonuclease-reverse transcriptase [Elysia marginata]|uniref:Endonuclease-reverse transcriptase n=1 Tax=Elysia marginata TaxID=1093978 RepID=A0AAV4IGA4_9GAST|nr:endonuclease-reverse transcriptase [Elysia marginata]